VSRHRRRIATRGCAGRSSHTAGRGVTNDRAIAQEIAQSHRKWYSLSVARDRANAGGQTSNPWEEIVFREFAGLGSLLKQAQQIGGRMQGLNEELRGRRATGTSGGGMVEIEVNGLVEVLGCRIDPKLLEQGDRELLEDLVATAVNQAVGKAKQLHAEAVKELTGNIELPGLDSALSKFLGQPVSENDSSETPQSKQQPPADDDDQPENR
jgi:hypothetical protein